MGRREERCELCGTYSCDCSERRLANLLAADCGPEIDTLEPWDEDVADAEGDGRGDDWKYAEFETPEFDG